TACRCETCPQARPMRSFASSSGATNASQVAAACVTAAMVLRPWASNSSSAGATWPGSISAKRGRPEKSSSGLLDTVLQKHGDGHRADAARHRRDPAGDVAYRVVVDVAGELAVRQAVDADVDHAGAGFDHLRGDEFRPPDGGDQHVALAAHRRQV